MKLFVNTFIGCNLPPNLLCLHTCSTRCTPPVLVKPLPYSEHWSYYHPQIAKLSRFLMNMYIKQFPTSQAENQRLNFHIISNNCGFRNVLETHRCLTDMAWMFNCSFSAYFHHVMQSEYLIVLCRYYQYTLVFTHLLNGTLHLLFTFCCHTSTVTTSSNTSYTISYRWRNSYNRWRRWPEREAVRLETIWPVIVL